MARPIANRRTALENAARTKALVIAYLNAHPNEPHTVLQLQNGLAEPLAAINASHSLAQTLARMAKNGLIAQSKQDENDIKSRCLYSASGSTFEPAPQNGVRKYRQIVHPDATKQLAVQLVGEGLSFATVGRRLGVLAKNVARWAREAKANPVAQQIAAADTVQLGRIAKHDNGLERENAELRVLLAKLLAELPVDRLARVLA